MKLKEQNINESQKPQLNIGAVSGSSIDKDLVEQRCKSVLKYLFPKYERRMTTKQYNNAMEALRSIAFGTPTVGRSEQFISLIRELIDVGIIDEDDIEVETWVNNYLKEIN